MLHRMLKKHALPHLRSFAEQMFRVFGMRILIAEYHPADEDSFLFDLWVIFQVMSSGRLWLLSVTISQASLNQTSWTSQTGIQMPEKNYSQSGNAMLCTQITSTFWVESRQSRQPFRSQFQVPAKACKSLLMDSPFFLLWTWASPERNRPKQNYTTRKPSFANMWTNITVCPNFVSRVQLTKFFVGKASGMNCSAPWNEISINNDDFIAHEFRPMGIKLQDPSDMAIDDVRACLAFWRLRQESHEPSQVFRFHQVSAGKDKDKISAPYCQQMHAKKRRSRTRSVSVATSQFSTPTSDISRASTPHQLRNSDLIAFSPIAEEPIILPDLSTTGDITQSTFTLPEPQVPFSDPMIQHPEQYNLSGLLPTTASDVLYLPHNSSGDPFFCEPSGQLFGHFPHDQSYPYPDQPFPTSSTQKFPSDFLDYCGSASLQQPSGGSVAFNYEHQTPTPGYHFPAQPTAPPEQPQISG